MSQSGAIEMNDKLTKLSIESEEDHLTNTIVKVLDKYLMSKVDSVIKEYDLTKYVSTKISEQYFTIAKGGVDVVDMIIKGISCSFLDKFSNNPDNQLNKYSFVIPLDKIKSNYKMDLLNVKSDNDTNKVFLTGISLSTPNSAAKKHLKIDASSHIQLCLTTVDLSTMKSDTISLIINRRTKVIKDMMVGIDAINDTNKYLTTSLST
jgi:hypothetical protein